MLQFPLSCHFPSGNVAGVEIRPSKASHRSPCDAFRGTNLDELERLLQQLLGWSYEGLLAGKTSLYGETARCNSVPKYREKCFVMQNQNEKPSSLQANLVKARVRMALEGTAGSSQFGRMIRDCLG